PAKLIVTLVGATIGGKPDPAQKTADKVNIFVRPARNVVNNGQLLATIPSLQDTVDVPAESQGTNGSRTKAGAVTFVSQNPAIFTVVSAQPGTRADSTTHAQIVSVANGVDTLLTIFDNVD